ncbi:3'-5' exonuclease [Flexistipes sp.]|uniref:3'-5' exonuclease n=1 Tax=Flexistipes sp. TaxID=3088135 RepID=UPI002E1DECC1|nr:3'-5' exonuclease [Flexistipes sp.]
MKHLDNKAVEILDTPLNKLSYVVFDLETTGTNPEEGDKIVEIGAVKIAPGFRIQHPKFHTLVNPEIAIPESSTKIHGITNEKVSDAPDICIALYNFIDFAKDSIIVAHNARKDFAFLKNEMKDYSITNPFRFVLDTLKLSRIMNPTAARHNLDDITEMYNIKIKGPYQRHRALYDAEATSVFFRILMKRIFRETCFTFVDLENLLNNR